MSENGALPPPPNYESAMLGQPYVIAPMAPHPFLYPDPSTLHHYVQNSTAPSAPPMSPPPGTSPLDQAGFWRHHGLDILGTAYQICITSRRNDQYSITDSTKSLLYTATVDMGTSCCCCSTPSGPGVTFNVASRNDQPVLIVRRTITDNCCSLQETEVNVSIPPDVALGSVEGRGSKFTLLNPAEDLVCYLKREDNCCNCANPPFEVVPAAFPHDVGLVEHSEDGLVVTFPAIFDPATRALLLAFALSMQYQHEEEVKAVT